MAQLVFGMGMSHSPMTTLNDSLWGEWAAQDSTFAILYDTEGQPVRYAELAERAGNRYAESATPQHWKQQCDAVRRAVARLATAVVAAKLDVLVIVGDDQLELFSFANMPALAIFYGDKIRSGLWTSRFAMYQRQGQPSTAPLSLELQRAVVESYAMDTHHEFASASEIRNWIAVSAACKHLKLAWDEYIPVYRTSAGTGCGLGFARWS